jgi:hypothetical protein
MLVIQAKTRVFTRSGSNAPVHFPEADIRNGFLDRAVGNWRTTAKPNSGRSAASAFMTAEGRLAPVVQRSLIG